MLSDIIGEAMEYTKKKFQNVNFIYPTYSPSKKKTSYPNVFICQLETEENFGEELSRHLQDWLVERVSKNNEIPEIDQIIHELILQVENLLSYDWVIIPTGDNQFETNEKLRQLFASVKKISRFNQLKTDKYSKCSNCGERDALISFGKRNKKAKTVINEFTPNKGKFGEILCGVCLTKRFWNFDEKIPSVSEIANKRIEKKLNEIAEFNQLKKEMKGQFDVQVIFEENVSSIKTVKNRFNLQVNKAELKKLQSLVKQINNQFKENDIFPKKYYAILLLDGDGMGKIVGGEYLAEKDKIKIFEKQQEVTKKLDKFTSDIRKIFKKTGDYRGELVYAGGDDVLAVLDYETALNTAWEIRKSYPKEMGGKKNPTASAGLIFANYRTNLSHVLSHVRMAEKKAKNVAEKNAITIGFFPRGGSAVIGTFKWKYNEVETITWLIRLIELLDESTLSSNFIYRLKEEFIFLEGVDLSNNDIEMIRLETERLVKRSMKEEKDSSTIAKEISTNLASLSRNADWETAINLLSIADALARRK